MLLRGEVQLPCTQIQDPGNEKEMETKIVSSNLCAEKGALPGRVSEGEIAVKVVSLKSSTVTREGERVNVSSMRQSIGTGDPFPVQRMVSPPRIIEAGTFITRSIPQVFSHNESCANVSTSVRDQSVMHSDANKQDKVRHWLDMERERMIESRLTAGESSALSSLMMFYYPFVLCRYLCNVLKHDMYLAIRPMQVRVQVRPLKI